MVESTDGYLFDLPEVPKSKKSFLRDMVDFLALAREENLMPQATAGRLIGVSRQAITDLVKRGRIREFRLTQGTFVSGKDLIAYWIQQNGGKSVPLHGTGKGKKIGLAWQSLKDAAKEST